MKKLLDYIYPRVFDFSSRETIIKEFQAVFNSSDMDLWIDSLAVHNVSEPLIHKGKQYRNVHYNMVMSFRFKDSTDMDDPEFVDMMIESFKKGIPSSYVRLHPLTKAFEIKLIQNLLAIKEESAAPWYFIGLSMKSTSIQKVLPDEVLLHFALDSDK